MSTTFDERGAVGEAEERVDNRLAVPRAERGARSPSLQLALRLAAFLGLPVEVGA
jgi:hypothetical protein